MQRPLVIVQARMGSRRLPGKVLKPILGHPLLWYTFRRLKALKRPVDLLLATSSHPEDDPLASFAKSEGLQCFRGSLEDVLERFYQASFGYKTLVRITGDCPLVQPALLEKMLTFFLNHSYEIVSNVIERSYPKGMDLEIFSFKALKKAYLKSSDPYDREHVTPYLYRKNVSFNFKDIEDLSTINLSVDTLEDFERVRVWIERYPQNPLFELEEMRHLLRMSNPKEGESHGC